MLITRKDRVEKPFETHTGERVYEMIGAPNHLGGATKHSFGHVVIPPNRMSRPHYHPYAEETYYILKGKGMIVINDVKHDMLPGDAVFISPPEKHQIFTVGNEDLEFIVISAPPWEPTNSVYLDENK